MTLLKSLPTELEQIIYDYKTVMENYDTAIQYIAEIEYDIQEDIFTQDINIETGLSPQLEQMITNINQHLNHNDYTCAWQKIFPMIQKAFHNSVFNS